MNQKGHRNIFIRIFLKLTKKSRENFYENNKEGKLKNLLDNFYYKEDIDSIVNEIEKLLNCG